MNAQEIPPVSDPFVLAYLKVHNFRASTPELEQQRNSLLLELAEWKEKASTYFASDDENKIEIFLKQREDVGVKARSILAQIDELQSQLGFRSASQPVLQDKLQIAQENVSNQGGINRTICTLEEIEQWEKKQLALRKAVGDARQALQDNMFQGQSLSLQVRQLNGEYRQIQSEEESLSNQIEQLKLPVDQRNKPRSSVTWKTSDGTGFMFQPTQ